jgi:hypothetical protein
LPLYWSLLPSPSKAQLFFLMPDGPMLVPMVQLMVHGLMPQLQSLNIHHIPLMSLPHIHQSHMPTMSLPHTSMLQS